MHNGLTWLAAFAMLPAMIFFAWAGYRVWRGEIVVLNRDGSSKSPLRYGLWTSFCAAFFVLLLYQAVMGQ